MMSETCRTQYIVIDSATINMIRKTELECLSPYAHMSGSRERDIILTLLNTGIFSRRNILFRFLGPRCSECNYI